MVFFRLLVPVLQWETREGYSHKIVFDNGSPSKVTRIRMSSGSILGGPGAKCMSTYMYVTSPSESLKKKEEEEEEEEKEKKNLFLLEILSENRVCHLY